MPTAMLGGLVLGLAVRWWAVPAVALAWSASAFLAAGADPAGAALLGAANALVGTSVAVGVRSFGGVGSPTP